MGDKSSVSNNGCCPTTNWDQSSSLEVVVGKRGIPDPRFMERLSKDEFKMIKEELHKLIAGWLFRVPPPGFKKTELISGYMVVVCSDINSKNWLKSEVENRKFGFMSLMIRELRPHPDSLIMICFEKSDSTRVLKLLQIQNSGLKTSDWIVRNEAFLNGNVDCRLIIEINKKSFEFLKNKNFLLHCGLNEIEIHTVYPHNKDLLLDIGIIS